LFHKVDWNFYVLKVVPFEETLFLLDKSFLAVTLGGVLAIVGGVSGIGAISSCKLALLRKSHA
jgi:hypothetical protein